MIATVEQYTKLFPDEADAIYGVFLSATYGATASQETVTAFETALMAGRRGTWRNFAPIHEWHFQAWRAFRSRSKGRCLWVGILDHPYQTYPAESQYIPFCMNSMRRSA
jgi:hypothetical protein